MIDEGESRPRLLGVLVVVLSGLLLAGAGLLLVSPALLVALLPGRLIDPAVGHLVIAIVGAVVVLVVAACLVVLIRPVRHRLAGVSRSMTLDGRSVAKGSAAAIGMAVWSISVLLPVLAADEPAQLADAVPSVFGDIGRITTAMVGSGLVALGLPLMVALVAAGRHRTRWMAGTLAVITLVILVPVVTFVHDGENRLQDERRGHRTACVYFVGGYDCPDR